MEPRLLPTFPSDDALDLRQGDCLQELRTLPDGCCDALLTDPPYRQTNLAFDQARLDWKAWWEQVHRVCTPKAVLLCFAIQPFATDLIQSNRTHFRYDLIWQKTYSTGFLAARQRPLRSHEHLLVFCRQPGLPNRRPEASVYNPQFTVGTPYRHRARTGMPPHYATNLRDHAYVNPGRRYPRSVLTFGRDTHLLHPTQKPLALMRWLVKTYSLPGQRILDPFLGSGTTGVACMEEGRAFVGIELDPRYFRLAQERLMAARRRGEAAEAGGRAER